MDYRNSLEDDEVEVLLGDALMIEEEEEVEQDIEKEVEQEVRQEIEQEVQQDVQHDVQREVQQEVRREVQQVVGQVVELVVEQVVEQNTTTALVQGDVARLPRPAIKRPAPKKSITNHPKVHHQPCQRTSQDHSTHPATVRISEDGPATHTVRLATPVVQQPKLASSTTGQPQGLTNDPANRRTSVQPRARVHRVKPMFPLHPVTGQPLGLRQSPREEANDDFQYMFDANHIKSKNSNLEIALMREKALFETRRDGVERAIERLEKNIRNKELNIELARVRRYVYSLFQIESSSPPFFLCSYQSRLTRYSSHTVSNTTADASSPAIYSGAGTAEEKARAMLESETAIAGINAEIDEIRLEIEGKKTELALRIAEINHYPGPKLFELPAEPEGYQAFRSGVMTGSSVGCKFLFFL